MAETHESRVPTFSRPPVRTEEIRMLQRLLVAIDRSPSTPVTLAYVTALARRDGASVHIVHVNRFLVGGRGHTELPDTEADGLVDDAVRLLAEEGLEATGSVAHSTCFTIGQVIAQLAHDHRSDLVVVGSRRRTRLAKVFGEGIRDRIIQYSTLPVLTAPAPMRVPRRGRHHAVLSAGRGGPGRTPVVR